MIGCGVKPVPQIYPIAIVVWRTVVKWCIATFVWRKHSSVVIADPMADNHERNGITGYVWARR